MDTFVILAGRDVVFGPSPWEPHILSHQLGLLGHSVSLGATPDRWSSADGAISLVPCEVVVEEHDPETHLLSQPRFTVTKDRVVAEYSASVRPDVREALCRRIDARKEALLGRGAPASGKFIAVDEAARADMGGMTLAAVLAKSGMPWPEGYSKGWIAIDNERVPLPTPDDGIAFSAQVGDWYARTVQHARSLKDEVLKAPDPLSVDYDAGWPE